MSEYREDDRPTPGELARNEHMRPGERFMTNAPTNPILYREGRVSADAIANRLDESGRFLSVRVDPNAAYSMDGTRQPNSAAIFVIPKEEASGSE